MRSYFRFLSRNKLYIFINIAGLSISLAFVIIIGLYSQMEFGRDKWHSKADRIFVATTEMANEAAFEGSHYYMQELLRSQFPEIESSCGLMMEPMDMTLADQEKSSKQIMFTDSTFFTLFDFPLTMGNPSQVLSQPGSIVVTEETAHLLFGSSDPMGKTVTLRDSMTFTVTGVMPQLNHTALCPCDAIVGIDVQRRLNPFQFDESMNSYGGTLVTLLARKGTDLRDKEAEINKMLSRRIDFFKPDAFFGQLSLRILPLSELYYSDAESIFTNRGDRKQSELLFIAGLVILLFAVMNYVNLTMAQSGFRMCEMAMRRLLGSQRRHVVGRLIAGSILLCLMSLVVALLLVCWSVPYANQLVKHAMSDFFWMNMSANADSPIIQFAGIWQPQSLCLLLCFTVVLGAVAGMAPAIVTSSAQPIEVVRGAFTRRTKMYFSRLFITAQHVITITLIAVSLVMWLQLLGIKVTADYGITGYDDEVKQKCRVFVTPKALAAENLPHDARSIKFQNVPSSTTST